MTELNIDKTLLRCVIESTMEGLSMAHLTLEPVGASRFLTGDRELSVLVSLYGQRSGHVTLNLSKGTAIALADRFLGEPQSDLSDNVLDAIGELGNMIAGRLKAHLLDTHYRIDAISVPALVIGANYSVHYHRGITSASVDFEIGEVPMANLKDKFFTTSISLLRS